MLGGLEGFLEDPVEHRSRGAPRLRRGVGVLHLAEDFRLADHLRVDAGGDLEKVLDGGAVVQLEPDLFEHARVHLVQRAQGGLQAGHRLGLRGDAVDLDAIAGVEHRELIQAGERLQFPVQGVELAAGQRQFLAQLERGGLVAGAEEKEGGDAHGLLADGGPAGVTGWRLALTGPRESRAAAKSARHVHARRCETSFLPRRSSKASR